MHTNYEYILHEFEVNNPNEEGYTNEEGYFVIP